MSSNRLWLVTVILLVTMASQAQSIKFEDEAACHTLQPASAGGPLPKNPNVLVLRYFSYGNYEVAYRGKVFLLDAFYDNSRSPLAAPTGLKESDVTKADAIFVGHTHLDHYQDAAPIAKRTGAPVYLAPPGVDYVKSQGLPDGQIKVVRGGETFKLNGYTVQTALGIHMAADPKAWGNYKEFVAKSTTATPDQQKQYNDWLDSLSKSIYKNEDPLDPDKDTLHHGTIVYVITFDDGFRLVYSDTAGVLSGGEKVLADQIHAKGGKVDVAILGYLDAGDSISTAIRTALARTKNWEPSIFLPSHFHDGDILYPIPMPEMPTAPLLEALRDQTPKTRGVSPLFRSPICVNTKTDEFFVGNDVR
jgi:L-ascorbate metabolism protein UlaG (beta-lactamase superfamily)